MKDHLLNQCMRHSFSHYLKGKPILLLLHPLNNLINIILRQATNVFLQVAPEDLPDVRRHIVDLILSTDMAYSAQISAQFRTQASDSKFNPTSSTEDAW